MRTFLICLGLFLAACAGDAPRDLNQGQALPPPGFPVSETPTGQVCGGMRMGEPTCGEGEYCHREISAQCGAADVPGVCRTLPQVCTREYKPVCGCDGQTYPNECSANAKGVSAAYAGTCDA